MRGSCRQGVITYNLWLGCPRRILWTILGTPLCFVPYRRRHLIFNIPAPYTLPLVYVKASLAYTYLVCGVGERDRGPLLREGDGLSGGAQLTGDLRGRARHVRQEGAPEGGGQTKQWCSRSVGSVSFWASRIRYTLYVSGSLNINAKHWGRKTWYLQYQYYDFQSGSSYLHSLWFHSAGIASFDKNNLTRMPRGITKMWKEIMETPIVEESTSWMLKKLGF